MAGANLYVHFPFCRSKCAYCALHSRPGASAPERDAYAVAVANEVSRLPIGGGGLSTVYFGGGTPCLCDLAPVFGALAPLLGDGCEFTVELHPLDVSPALLDTLRAGGVNRISMGVQSLEDGVLAAMGRGYSADDAERAFAAVRSRFDNAGTDLIVGYPGENADVRAAMQRLGGWGLAHCSVYSLQNERGLADVPDDDAALDRVSQAAGFLRSIGLERYEISNYARPGMECRHNFAVWRGEDYFGVGEGACGRVGLTRTRGVGSHALNEDSSRVVPFVTSVTSVSSSADATERCLFRLRTREGLDAAGRPEWRTVLDRFAAEGLLSRDGDTYRLTLRGTEVCDTILEELV